MLSVTVEQLLADEGVLALELLAGEGGLSRPITTDTVDRPGLVLTGHFRDVNTDRVLVLGATEITLLNSSEGPQRRAGILVLVHALPACLVITRSLTPPADLVSACAEHSVALLRTSLSTSLFIHHVERALEKRLAPSSSIHGVLLDVLGIGVLLLGKSGIGKSEVALDLILRGHRLVADDIVEIRKTPPNAIVGSGSPIIRHHMEIRGLGIISVKDLFGAAAVRDTKKIELVVELEEWRGDQEYDRLGVDEIHHRLLDSNIPYLCIPVRPGRSMASLVEVAARNQLLKLQGRNPAREFQERLNRAIAEAHPRNPGTESE